ncbi:helix-turn-helix domain-containing protein [Emticicia fontis]
MGRVLTIELIVEQKAELEHFYKQSTNHILRQRCQIILLKSANRKTSDICDIVGIKSQNQVNKWIKPYKKHYLALGIEILRNKEGQERKPIFDSENEAQLIKNVVISERQKLTNAKEIFEKELNKMFNIKTLRNFLKTLAGDINV